LSPPHGSQLTKGTNSERTAARRDELRLLRMKCETAPGCDETGPAVRATIPAPRRKPLATAPRAAYSAFIDTEHCSTRKERTMNANFSTPVKARVAAFVGAVITSALVLGSTVAGMQPKDGAVQLAALERAAASTTVTR
jgi:hypothetical protein